MITGVQRKEIGSMIKILCCGDRDWDNEEAIYDALLDYVMMTGDEMAKSLNSLIKYNDGLWKSDRQARFILNSVWDDKDAQAWAKKKGYKGKAFSINTRFTGYGKRDVSKIRIFTQAFVVDNGGVVARAKVKFVHPKEGNEGYIDWDSYNVTFERTAKPSVKVDIDKEKRDAIKKNQPDIKLIKSIPNYEDKDILVSFLRQLESGSALTIKQKAILQRMVPEKKIELGDKAVWISAWEEYKKILGHRGLYGAIHDNWVEMFADDPRSDKQKQINEIKKAGMNFTKTGKSDIFWLDNEPVNILHSSFNITRPRWAGGYSDYIHDEMQKIIKAPKSRKMTKRGADVLSHVLRVVDRFKGKRKSFFKDAVSKYYKN